MLKNDYLVRIETRMNYHKSLITILRKEQRDILIWVLILTDLFLLVFDLDFQKRLTLILVLKIMTTYLWVQIFSQSP